VRALTAQAHSSVNRSWGRVLAASGFDAEGAKEMHESLPLVGQTRSMAGEVLDPAIVSHARRAESTRRRAPGGPPGHCRTRGDVVDSTRAANAGGTRVPDIDNGVWSVPSDGPVHGGHDVRLCRRDRVSRIKDVPVRMPTRALRLAHSFRRLHRPLTRSASAVPVSRPSIVASQAKASKKYHVPLVRPPGGPFVRPWERTRIRPAGSAAGTRCPPGRVHPRLRGPRRRVRLRGRRRPVPR
jgi:hypothetical protein